MRKHDHSKEHENKIDLTPMIDCVFLLVMFFVLTSSFVFLEEINLPVAFQATDVGKRDAKGAIIINVLKKDDSKRTGEIRYNREPHTPEALAEALKLESRIDADRNGWDDPVLKLSKLEVIVRVDEGVQGMYARQIFEACVKAGIWKLSVSAMRE